MTNYLANSWTPTAGCQRCAKNKIDLSTIEVILFFHHMLQKNRVCKNNRCTCALCMTVVAYRRVAYVCLLSCRTVTFRWFTSRCISNTPRRFWIASLRCWPRKNIPRIACMSSSTTWWVRTCGSMLLTIRQIWQQLSRIVTSLCYYVLFFVFIFFLFWAFLGRVPYTARGRVFIAARRQLQIGNSTTDWTTLGSTPSS